MLTEDGILAQAWYVRMSPHHLLSGHWNMRNQVGRIGADASYDASSAVGLVRAAERAKSPAILQLFPISLEYGGVAYLRYCVEL